MNIKFSGYDKAILCAGVFFLFVALMTSCGTPSYIAPDKQMTEKNIYDTFVKEGIIDE
jgi:hypothetical protein